MAGKSRTLSVYLQLRSKAFTTGLRSMERRMMAFGKSVSAIGSRLTMGLSMPLALVGAASIKLATDFQTSMTKIATLVGMPADKVNELKERVKELSGKTATAPRELADGLYFLTSAGLSAESALKALEAVAKGTAMGLGEQTDLAKVAAAAQNAYGEEVLTASHALDIFGQMVKTGMFESSELAEVLGTQLGLASSLGISMEELGAMIATYTRTTGDARMATTGLSGIMMNFAKITPRAARNLRKATQDMEGGSMSADDLRKMLGEQGLQKTLIFLQKEFKNSGMQMSDFFAKSQALKGVLGVLGEQTDSYTGILDEMYEATGFVEKGFETAAQTAEGKFKQSIADLSTAGIELGNSLLPIVTKIAQKLGDLAKKFSGMSTDAKAKILKLGAVLIGLGPGLMVVGGITQAFALLLRAVRLVRIEMIIAAAVAALFNPFTYILGAIVLIIGGMIKHWDKVKVVLVDVINYFITLYNENQIFRAAIEAVGFAFGALWERAKFFGKNVVAMFKGVGKVLINLFDKEERGKAVDELLASLNSNFDDFTKGVQDKYDKMVSNIQTKEAIELVSVEDVDAFVQKGEDMINAIKEGAMGKVVDLQDWFNETFATLAANTGDVPGGGGEGEDGGEGEEGKGNDILNPNVEEVQSRWDQIVETIKGAYERISITTEDLGNAFGSAFDSMADSTESGLKAMKNAVYNSVRDIIKAKLREAVMGYAASIFKSVPFPLNIGLAATAGAVVGTLFNSIMPPLAAGGLAMGPTAALVGEGRGTSMYNPEVIAPLDKLKNYMGGGSGTQRLSGTIDGTDIIIATDRTQANRYRVAGSAVEF